MLGFEFWPADSVFSKEEMTSFCGACFPHLYNETPELQASMSP